MEKRTAILVGLSGVLLYALGRLVLARMNHADQWHSNQKKVDTTSEDSFPASDPPSWSTVQSAGTPST